MSKDRIYRKPQSPVLPFEFDHQVAGVFDDMLDRSIPLYREIIRLQVMMTQRFYQPGTRIYDLGCSNGNLGVALCGQMDNQPFQMVAVDSSAPMLEAYARRLAAKPQADAIKLACQDICRTPIENASVVVLNFTLQFLPPEKRDAMIGRIYQGLAPGGALLFSEKIAHKDRDMSALQQDFYYAFKRENGYSELEISQKREALEEVLVPEPLERHVQRLHGAGFASLDIWLKWFNFAALLAVKNK